MVVWEFPCESRTLLNFLFREARYESDGLFAVWDLEKVKAGTIALWPYQTPFVHTAAALQKWNAVSSGGRLTCDEKNNVRVRRIGF